MFRHKGKNRTFSHNLRLATLLSFVAGIVNVTGVLAVKTLTTNVTGHFAFFAEELLVHNYSAALTFFVFTVFFLIGSFTSSFLSEYMLRISPEFSHVAPISLEIIVLLVIGFFGIQADLTNFSGQFIAFSMLFAMGIQNSLVTKISQSTVRTTHLTGLFTDLGIELSQLFFYKKEEETKKLKTSIFLRLSIITFFFIGCVSGGFIYQIIEIKTLLVAAFFLIIALFYDTIRFKYLVTRRKKSHH
ncbi:YoaK family protein [Flavobacterium sp.]|uniref:YoaK family protein n=1 Tax=Flavobacterium sp. TaxID=239 RepID=UPI002B4B81EC|nr:YoaK family protein [Flavobacterium sp.]HLF52885.1 YoaK family protein [Flavobacterium sp.]